MARSDLRCSMNGMDGELVDAPGIEPGTSRLRVECSTS